MFLLIIMARSEFENPAVSANKILITIIWLIYSIQLKALILILDLHVSREVV